MGRVFSKATRPVRDDRLVAVHYNSDSDFNEVQQAGFSEAENCGNRRTWGDQRLDEAELSLTPFPTTS
jgi:hypothetical protein